MAFETLFDPSGEFGGEKSDNPMYTSGSGALTPIFGPGVNAISDEYGGGAGNPLDPGGFSAGGGFGLDSDEGQWISFLSDPVDLFGERGEYQRDALKNIQMGSAKDAIASQRKMKDYVNALYQPYEQAAGLGFQNYMGLTAGGGGVMPMSPEYQRETELGARGVNRAMAGRGLFNSSARGAGLADMYLNAGQNEARNQYGKQLDLQQIGTRAIGALGDANRTAGSNVGAIYGNTGSNLNAMYSDMGTQRGNLYRDIGSNVGQLFGGK